MKLSTFGINSENHWVTLYLNITEILQNLLWMLKKKFKIAIYTRSLSLYAHNFSRYVSDDYHLLELSAAILISNELKVSTFGSFNSRFDMFCAEIIKNRLVLEFQLWRLYDGFCHATFYTVGYIKNLIGICARHLKLDLSGH